jgi:rod shape-determining protein MreD
LRTLAFVLAGLSLAAAQAVLLRWFGGGAVPLQLLVACIAWLAMEAEVVEGVVASAGIGFAMDLFAGTPDGLFTFTGVLVYLACRAAGMAVDLKGRAGFPVLAGAACLATSVCAISLQRWAGVPEAAPGGGLVPRVLVEALLTALAAPLVRIGMARLDGLLGREEPGLSP